MNLRTSFHTVWDYPLDSTIRDVGKHVFLSSSVMTDHTSKDVPFTVPFPCEVPLPLRPPPVAESGRAARSDDLNKDSRTQKSGPTNQNFGTLESSQEKTNMS